MSSFIDRWLYDRGNNSNSGTNMLNTGSYNSAAESVTPQEKFKNYVPKKLSGTTPNLTNIPYSYYAENRERRMSDSSVSSEDSDT